MSNSQAPLSIFRMQYTNISLLSRHMRSFVGPLIKAAILRLPVCTALFLLLATSPLLCPSLAEGGEFFYPFSSSEIFRSYAPVIGSTTTYTIQKKDTLLDIARDFDLGFHELHRLYPDLATWMPAAGMRISIPRMWITPRPPREPQEDEIVVNLAEMRLFHFNFERKVIRSYPVGIGTPNTPTRTGSFLIDEKVKDPSWTVPPSLEDKYEISKIEPGEQNPLGRYWLGLGDTHLGLHGTNFAWSVGRATTNGCIRLYPEDISRIFSRVNKNTRVHIVYEPVKFGVKKDKVLAEIHPDLYNRIDDLAAHAYTLLQEKGLVSSVDMNKLRLALQRRSGRPVTLSPEAGRNEE